MNEIITIGGASQDIYLLADNLSHHDRKKIIQAHDHLEFGEKVEFQNSLFEVGGGGTNAACTFAKLGFKVGFWGRVGKDAAGAQVIKTLKKFNVATNLIEEDPKTKTAFSVICLKPNTEKTILIFRGAEINLKASDVKLAKLHEAKWFYISSLGGNLTLLKEILNYAAIHNIKVALNPGSKEIEQGQKFTKILKHLEILIMNLEEAQKLTGQTAQTKIFKKLKSLADIAVITLGAKGVIAADENSFFRIHTKPVKNIQDSTGAGDAFASAFVAGMIRREKIKFALKLGITNARSVIKKIGAKNGIIAHIPKHL